MKKVTEDYVFSFISLSCLLRLISISLITLIPEEAYYWNYSMHFDSGYLDHPPMVAALIKIFTQSFGTTEFAVRLSSLICWFLTAWYSYQLTQLIKEGAGRYSLMLLAILPFFFLHSLIITPDLPLMLCWSASLLYLYRCLVLEEQNCWYYAGLWLGLGLLSKYTIVLLGFTTLIYLVLRPAARKWFLRKEPYFCALITAILFLPVIYWNAKHQWASFAFQSTRRLDSAFYFSFHQLIGLLLVFLTPLGILGFWKLFRKIPENATIDSNTKSFIRIFTLVPFLVFSVFSLSHEIKFNWIGPGFLALLPWLAVLMHSNQKNVKGWFITATVLLIGYSSISACIVIGKPSILSRTLLNKYIAWDKLAQHFNEVAKSLETKNHITPIIVPMDKYNIASELSFYQAKLLQKRKIEKAYPVTGSHVFGGESLMYRYWDKDRYQGKKLLLISTFPESFNYPEVLAKSTAISPTMEVWAYSQGSGNKIRKYFYRVVEMKH